MLAGSWVLRWKTFDYAALQHGDAFRTGRHGDFSSLARFGLKREEVETTIGNEKLRIRNIPAKYDFVWYSTSILGTS